MCELNELNELNGILLCSSVTTVFQPIVSLNNGEILGYEALTRGPKDSILQFPDKLFNAASKYNMLWELELLCRSKAIEKASILKLDKLLFLNVDPQIIRDDKFKRGFTKEFLKRYNISPKSIVFELTEKSAIEDYEGFSNALKNYTGQGYKIAIDDTGSGYSGLKTISETKPHYLKIDMDLIRNIDKDPFKQALIKTFVDLSIATNIKLIAEGIETLEELRALIELGVYAGQGYYLNKPKSILDDIPEDIKSLIVKFNNTYTENFYTTYHHIGEIAEEKATFNLDTPCCKVKDYFDTKNVDGACIVKDNVPLGLIMRNNLDSLFAKNYGAAVFYRRPVKIAMDNHPLIVDYYTHISSVSEAAMSRDDHKTYDYIIITKESKYYGIVTIKKLLQYTTALERNYAKELNPLTGLPGNVIINKVLKDAISYNKKYCVLYFDLDNFKIYNDLYGFENGDKILEFTANLISSKVKRMLPHDSFVGHIGGDDFFCVLDTSTDLCNKLCKDIMCTFDEEIVNFFNENHRRNGFIQSEDRNGVPKTFNLTSISIAGCYGSLGQFNSPHDLAQYMSTIKKEAKKLHKSSYIINTL